MSKHTRRLNQGRWQPLSLAIRDRDDNQCVMCGSDEDLTCDHIYPLSLMTDEEWEEGLPYAEPNLRTLCRRCNSMKSARIELIENFFDKEWLNSIH